MAGGGRALRATARRAGRLSDAIEAVRVQARAAVLARWLRRRRRALVDVHAGAAAAPIAAAPAAKADVDGRPPGEALAAVEPRPAVQAHGVDVAGVVHLGLYPMVTLENSYRI